MKTIRIKVTEINPDKTRWLTPIPATEHSLKTLASYCETMQANRPGAKYEVVVQEEGQ